ncbi:MULTISPECIES: NADPH-dependent assimilatory sulfite reductase hemoprotein subunit [Prochlorococcus]|uniref:NADPH-dependent assimilatory sulfite reductase hemoprotein subunit n=1 Tax=Prochlorococcus TaxID=1218 RepID=UPI00068CD380|nr:MULTISPECIES: NADPH-dependent assimilatory sulfite reductase hemoprotein subunit [Prochlorococcus]
MDDGPLSPCIANGQDRSKFEQFKADSDYLREPLYTELRNDSNHFTNDAVQLLKFHGSYQQDHRENRSKEKGRDWQMMLRLRCPGGLISAKLFCALDSLSEELGNQTLRVTTRQAFQMHGIRKENLKTVINTIVKSMGSTLAACGDINRNVMAPAAPFIKDGYPAARKLANDIADLLSPSKAEHTYLELWADGDLSYKIAPSEKVIEMRKKQFKGQLYSGDEKEPLYGATYLPRKFKCAVTVPGDNSVDLLTQDIGIVVFTDDKQRLKGCNVYVGGGMGRTHNNEQTFAQTAKPLGYIEGDRIFELVQSILALQRDYGDRKLRKHSRMKYLIHDKGIDWFIQKLKAEYFKYTIHTLKKEKKAELKDYLGWHSQSKNQAFVGIPLLSGRISGEIKKGLKEIINKYQLEIRLTPNQDLLLCNIGKFQIKSIKDDLRRIGISSPESPEAISRHALACPALPLCGLAITEAERALPDILQRMKVLLKEIGINKTILIRMTGCPNGCSRPYMAELALVGSGADQYQLWLGGSPNLERLAKPFLQKMTLSSLEETITPLLISWKNSKANISFGDHLIQIGEQRIQGLLSVNS